MAVKTEKSEYFTYKGLPLVRSKDYIYFGDPAETHIIFISILSSDNDGIPSKVSVELLLTDETLPPMKRLLKRGEKTSLYEALDIGLIWLQRALKDKK